MSVFNFEVLRRMAMGTRLRTVISGILAPLLAALLLCGVGTLWPVRLDYRSLQDLLRFQNTSLPQSAGDFVFLSRDNSVESARIATFGLRQLAFPSGSVYWAALKEECSGSWENGFVAVDMNGNAFRPAVDASSQLQWRAAETMSIEDQLRISRRNVVFDTASTRASFEQRWPFLKQANNIVVLSESPPVRTVVLRRPASEFTITRTVRIATVLGSFLAIVFVLLRFDLLNGLNSGFIFGGAVFLSVGLNLWLTYMLQLVLPGTVQWSSAMLWIGLLAFVTFFADHEKGRIAASQDLTPVAKISKSVRLFLIFATIAYAAVFLVRLDFDGDFFNNWLPQGRFHYLLGWHDPVSVIGQGSMQAASYPPGYGILLSRLMWISDLNPAASFLIGADTSFAILLYRLFILAINLSLFALVGIYVNRLARARTGMWLVVLLFMMLLIPSTAGKHIASETLLFPMLGGAIVMIAAGRNLEVPGLPTMGLIVAGAAALIKVEGTVLLAAAVLPWLVSSLWHPARRVPRNVRVTWIATVVLSLLPVFIWEATLQVHNEFFVPMTWTRLVSSFPLLASLFVHAARLLFEDGRLMLLLFALPGATLLRFVRAPHWPALLIPLSTAALLIGWVVVFVFTDVSPITFLDNAYSRLAMVPTFGAILYCAEAILSRDSSRQTPDTA